MITPRRTRLLRVPGLSAFHRAIAAASCPPDIDSLRPTAVIVPSTAATAELRVTLENLLLLGGPGGTEPRREAVILPDLVTRDEWYRRMHARLPLAPPALSRLEREVLARAAAREAIDAGFAPPFRLRPGLLGEILDLYDDLHRHRRTLDAFERLILGELEPRADTDRGAARLLAQTRFLLAAFRAYERRRRESGRLDEKALRDELLQPGAAGAYAHVVVTVGDRTSDAAGLYAADFDLLTRVDGLESLDIVATEGSLEAGLGDRLREMLPGVEEAGWIGPGEPGPGLRQAFSASRDREDELAEVARTVKARRHEQDNASLDRTAVVFRRPLPYVYLAQTIFDAAGIPFQAADALPLAAEPYAAALDLVFSFVESGFTRTSTTALLSCPHFSFDQDGARIGKQAVTALDGELAAAGYLGGNGELARIAAGLAGPAGSAARAAAAAADELGSLTAPAPASNHLAALLAFLEGHDRPRAPEDEAWERHQRARAAIRAALEDLGAAHARYDDPVERFEATAATVRRWMETQTFAPRTGNEGVHLVDAPSARYGDYDDVYLVGLVEPDWPGSRLPNVFYPSSLLTPLGWPADRARLAGIRAEFLDLAGLPRRALTLSSFTLEDDAIVERSPLLEDVADAAGRAQPVERRERSRIFAEEALLVDPVRDDVLPIEARRWLELRRARTAPSDPRFHGAAGPYVPDVYAVSAVDLYLECPFKFFATYVLRIEEEPEDDEGLDPRARGEFVHEILREFYEAWDGAARGAISAANLGEARRAFADVVERALERLPAGDAATERLRLLGSPVAPGVGEIVLGAEAARPWAVSGRLLEQNLEGEFDIAGGGRTRRVRLRGKADRIDLLGDHSIRIVDYKTGRAPEWRRSIQLPIYAVCAGEWLRDTRGGEWTVTEAAYLALAGGDNVRVIAPDHRGTLNALVSGQQRFLDAIDGMARGEFPPRPVETYICSYCRFSAVCRKDYVVDR